MTITRFSVFCITSSNRKSSITAWKVTKYGVFSGPCFHVFSPNTGKYGPEKTPYLDTNHAVHVSDYHIITCDFANDFLCLKHHSVGSDIKPMVNIRKRWSDFHQLGTWLRYCAWVHNLVYRCFPRICFFLNARLSGNLFIKLKQNFVMLLNYT